MSDDDIKETLERLGYAEARLDAMFRYCKEYARRKCIVESHTRVTADDIVVASLVFDAFNCKQKGK